MKLESFRIRNCFGFWDSDDIELSHPGNLVYFLGRNSSGKTSVLRAVSHFENRMIPEQHPNFRNYANLAGSRVLQARFSVEPSEHQRLSVDSLLDGVVGQFGSAGLRFEKGEDGFLVTAPSVSDAQQATALVATLLDRIRDIYSTLIEQILAQGHVWVEKHPNGSYVFLTEVNSRDNFEKRQESIGSVLRRVNSALTARGLAQVSLDSAHVERLLFMQFPEILFFSDRFSLDDDLPRSLRGQQTFGG